MKTYNIIIPAYNEEKIIRKNLTKIAKKLIQIGEKYKILFVLSALDDGSTDDTESEIIKVIYDETLKSDYLSVFYLGKEGPTRRENLVKTMNISPTDYVGFMDCDLATDLKDLENLIACSFFYDIVSGSRYITSSKIKRTWTRRLISFCYNTSMRIMFGSTIRDHECGFKIFKTSAIRKIIKYTEYGEHKKDRKMAWDTEMWIYAQRLGFKVLEIPVTWKEAKKSALRFTTELSMIKYLLKLRWKLLWMKKN